MREVTWVFEISGVESLEEFDLVDGCLGVSIGGLYDFECDMLFFSVTRVVRVIGREWERHTACLWRAIRWRSGPC
jgi:hypothetical protein